MSDTPGMRDMGTFTHDGKTFNVKAATAMCFIQWEIFEDYGVTIPEHLETHRGHRYVTAQRSAFGWNFDKWSCGQCDTNSDVVKFLGDLKVHFDQEILGPQGMMLVTTRCECSHSITNHLGGRCNVCPCQRSATTMAVKLNIEE